MDVEEYPGQTDLNQIAYEVRPWQTLRIYTTIL